MEYERVRSGFSVGYIVQCINLSTVDTDVSFILQRVGTKTSLNWSVRHQCMLAGI